MVGFGRLMLILRGMTMAGAPLFGVRVTVPDRGVPTAIGSKNESGTFTATVVPQEYAIPLMGLAVDPAPIAPPRATVNAIGPPLELQTMSTVIPVEDPEVKACVAGLAAVGTAVNLAGAAWIARVTTIVGLVAIVELNCTEAEYVPGSIAAAVAFAWKEIVATALVVPAAVPVCVTVSQSGTVLVTT
jgi:hypothetical protein